MIRKRKAKKQLTWLQQFKWIVEHWMYKIGRLFKVIVLVGLINALFTYCFWSLTNRVTELEQTSQETLLLMEETMKEVSSWETLLHPFKP